MNSRFWKQSSKFIFVAIDFPENAIGHVSSFFYLYTTLNVIMVRESAGVIKVFSYNPFYEEATKRFYEITSISSSVADYYPDKLRNLNAYAYKIIFLRGGSRNVIKGETLTGTDVEIMKLIAQHQKASCKFYYINEDELTKQNFAAAINNPNIDLTIEISLRISSEIHTFVEIYETDGFCAIVPLPKRKSFFDILFKPFDSWTWILIFATMLFSGTAWFFINKRFHIDGVTTGYFIFSYIAYFIGQSVPFREHHKRQKVLLQLTILLTFVLGNAYQSLIISYISDAKNGERITTIDDMIAQNFSFFVDPIFQSMFKTSEDYRGLKSQIIATTSPVLENLNFSKLASENVALIFSCSLVDVMLNKLKPEEILEKKPIYFYYKVPEILYSFYLKYVTTPFSPFGSRLQELVSIIFESGIKQHLLELVPGEDLEARMKREYYENEEYLLNLEDLSGVFYILTAGMTIAFLVLLLELFARDFLRNVDWIGFKKALRGFFNRSGQHRRMRGVFQVRPIEA